MAAEFSLENLDDSTVQKLRELASENQGLNPQQGLRLVIFTDPASQGHNVLASEDVNQIINKLSGPDVCQLLTELRGAYMHGEPTPPIPCCVVPVKPLPMPPPGPGPEPGPAPEPDEPYNQ